jgi:Holliday junction DNA helicase RuvB
MARERVLRGEEAAQKQAEAQVEESIKSLRPKFLAEYIGQTSVADSLRVAVTAARNRGEPLDHVLFHGPPGLGKTTLAHILAREMNSNIVATSGPALEKPKDLLGIVSNLEEGDVLFIDEIHRLSRMTEEYLYPAMEDFQVDLVIDKGAFAQKKLKLSLKRFTLVGATTRAGSLSAPMRDRFGIFCHLDYYSVEELTLVVKRSAGILGVPITEEGAQQIGRRSRGTPRIANRLLRRVRDYAEVEGDGTITQEIAAAALDREGIDEIGLDRLDRALLATTIDFYRGGPVGIEALSATLNEEADTLVDMVEPYLLKIGMLVRTPSGRKATEAAFRHLGRTPQPAAPTLFPTM